MLNITPQANAAGAKSYFAVSDYYSEGQEINGEWGGKGAALLGLSGQVEEAEFNAMCDNLHPVTGKPLTRVTRSDRRVGYDFTWSAPKSVSVVHALTGDDSIMSAFRASINDTMTEMEADMQARVRKRGQDVDRNTGNMAWAEFIHLTSRPVNGMPCPQLHAHCFAFNASYDAIENQWKAGQFGKIKGDAYYWQAVQQARFANRLQELGYSIRPTKDAFEIAGVPESALDKFSLRTKLIERVAERLGITDASIKAKLGATTRERKASTIPYSDLVSLWRSQLTDSEAESLEEVAANKRPAHPVFDNAAHANFAADHVFERASVADERRLQTLALRHGIGEVTPEGVRAETDRLGLLKREEGGKVWVTTKQVLAEETRMLRFATSGKGSCRPLAAAGMIEWRDARLNKAQRAAVEHVLTSPNRVMLIRGAAGTGKSTLTKEAVSQMESHGKQVVMLAPSAQASRGVLRDEGFADADTLAKFLVDEKMQAAAREGYIWLDEAGLVGSKTLAQLFDLAEHLQARVILSGDKRQMASVERGAALRALEEFAGLSAAEVTEIQRQQGDYKEAVKLLSDGETLQGYEALGRLGWVKLLPAWDAYEPIAREYADYWEQAPENQKDKAALIVCPTHAEGDAITLAVRSELKARGIVAGEEHEFSRLVPLQWTEAERADVKHYKGEEIIQFHHDTGPFKAGQRIAANQVVTKLGEVRARHFAAYQPESISLAAGDTVRITANGKTLDGKHKLNNGAVYRIAGFTKAGDIKLANGWQVSKDFGHLSHGYVSTSHAAQGRTVDHVLVAQSSMSYPAASKEGFYVAVSRGRKSCTIYTDDRRELKEAIQRSSPRLTATELARKPKQRILQRMRRAVARIQQAAVLAAKQAAHELRDELRPLEPSYER